MSTITIQTIKAANDIKETPELTEAAVALAQAEKAMTSAFNDYFNILPLLPDRPFWQILEKYRKLVKERLASDGRQGLTDWVVDEFFRLSYFTPSNGYTTLQAIQFAKTYSTKAGALYKPLFERTDSRGDDSYGDLLDSLILLGPAFFKDAIEGRIGDVDRDAVPYIVRAFGKGNTLAAKHILHGENYNAFRLKEQARHAARVVIVANQRDRSED